MNAMIGAILPAAVGILLSPELWLVAMWFASIKDRPLKKVWAFFAGGVVGLTAFFVLGFFLHSMAGNAPSWPRFILRGTLGTIMLFLALHVYLKGHNMHRHLNEDNLGSRVNVLMAAGFGFVLTGLNIKVILLAIAAGHDVAYLSQILNVRLYGLSVFYALALAPMLVPALIQTILPGFIGRVMAPCNRLIMKYGQIIVVIVCVVFGAMLWKQAISIMP